MKNDKTEQAAKKDRSIRGARALPLVKTLSERELRAVIGGAIPIIVNGQVTDLIPGK